METRNGAGPFLKPEPTSVLISLPGHETPTNPGLLSSGQQPSSGLKGVDEDVAVTRRPSNGHVRIAHAEFDRIQPEVVVASSRGWAVAMSIDIGETPLVLMCSGWKRWGNATTISKNSVILHSRADDVVPFTAK